MADKPSFRAAFGVTEAAQAPLARRGRNRAGFAVFAPRGGAGTLLRAAAMFYASKATTTLKAARRA